MTETTGSFVYLYCSQGWDDSHISCGGVRAAGRSKYGQPRVSLYYANKLGNQTATVLRNWRFVLMKWFSRPVCESSSWTPKGAYETSQRPNRDRDRRQASSACMARRVLIIATTLSYWSTLMRLFVYLLWCPKNDSHTGRVWVAA